MRAFGCARARTLSKAFSSDKYDRLYATHISLQFKDISSSSGKPTCAPLFQKTTPPIAVPLKQLPTFVWLHCRWPFRVLSRKITEHFLFLSLSPPGDRSCDVLGFVPLGCVPNSYQYMKSSKMQTTCRKMQTTSRTDRNLGISSSTPGEGIHTVINQSKL